MSDEAISATAHVPNVYFIDDSATMREVIKIAFRKESMHVVACHDAASAMALFEEAKPDAVITDVIMPDKDGYEVCRFVKSHPEFSATPVILMSGVVNRQVAEKAMEVKADELMRKPFQPQELVTRVKSLLNPKSPSEANANTADPTRPPALSNLFATQTPSTPPPTQQFASSRPSAPNNPPFANRPAAQSFGQPAQPRVANNSQVAEGARQLAPTQTTAELLKLRSEVRRLEMLVKKLQSELEGERQYCAELESQLRVHQES